MWRRIRLMARVLAWALALGSLPSILGGCARLLPRGGAPESGIAIETAPAPSAAERYCAWYGDARDGVLYVGEAPFGWADRKHGGDPTGDRREAGPQRIGRFDLRRRRLLEPLAVGSGDDRSGVWDVLAHPNGRIYFTTYFESAGFVDPETGAVRRRGAETVGLNELELGPDGTLLASRYAGADGRGGSVVVLHADGAVLRELPLEPPAGYRVAPKTVAYDRRRREIWVTTDLLPEDPSRAMRHDTYVLDADGRELRRIERPEIQFAAFAPDGTGYWAERDGRALHVRIEPADAATPAARSGRRIELDSDFEGELDFVQDIKFARDGRAVLTRWSGWVHLVEPGGRVETLRLPRIDAGGLYYSAVAANRFICSTHCADVTVVCVPAGSEAMR